MIRSFRNLWNALFGATKMDEGNIVVTLPRSRQLVDLEAAFFIADMPEAFRVAVVVDQGGTASEEWYLAGQMIKRLPYVEREGSQPRQFVLTKEQDRQLLDLMIEANNALEDRMDYSSILAYSVLQTILAEWVDSMDLYFCNDERP